MNVTREEMVFDLLGGRKFLEYHVSSSLEAHDLIVSGIPAEAVFHMIGKVSILSSGDALKRGVGISLRSLQRKKILAGRAGCLSPSEGSRAWRFAEIYAHATDVFGDEETAGKWMLEPSIGLDNRRPIDLIMSSVGASLVEKQLIQIDYGVYT
ncbi:MAG: DUF2384 domain-containing protein [Loktanella sp.]|nr:DUF2384 domain-containing protein [Loktanella sp.]